MRPWSPAVTTRRLRLTLLLESHDYEIDPVALEELARGLAGAGATLAARGGGRARILELELGPGGLVATIEDTVASSPLVTVRYSADRRFYYVVGDLQVRLRTWLSVEAMPGPLPRERVGSIPDASWFEFAPQGEPWHHRAGFDLRSSRIVLGEQEVIEKTSPLFLDYAAAARAVE